MRDHNIQQDGSNEGHKICNIFCDPPLEPSRRDGSNEGSQHMFSLRNKKHCL